MHVLRRSWTGIGAATLLAALAVALPGSSTASPPIQVFILAGQSNMIGRAMPVSDGTGPTPNLLQFRDGVWQPASDPLGPLSDPDSGVGPGMTFGVGVLDHEPPGTTVGLIMCARGSSAIGTWRREGSNYRRCRNLVRDAGGQVAGIVFLQGEHEAAIKRGGRAWARGFADSERAFEREFGPVPFVLGQIGALDPTRSPYQQSVRDAQAAAAVGHPEIALVPSVDLPMVGVHYTLPAYKELGTRFAEAWYGLSLEIPAMTGVSLGSGVAGDSVTITGSGLDLTTSVNFGPGEAHYQIVSPTEISATVPDAALTGPVVVRTPLGIATSADSFGVRPTITSFDPDAGKPGTDVVVRGKTFVGTTTVTVGGEPVPFTVRSATRLKLTVPPGTPSGAIAVTNAGGTTSSVTPFEVDGP